MYRILFFLPIILSACSTTLFQVESEKIGMATQEFSEPTLESREVIRAFSSDGLSTDTSKRSIPLSDILDGGPGKDGIPAIDIPDFIQVSEAIGQSHLEEDTLGVVVKNKNIVRFYPYSILVWHEIVNDVLGDVPVSVTYCPLCGTAIVYDRRTMSGVLDFGVSGRLWQSNLLMYDRQTESLWSQAEGRAVVGTKNGQQLEYYPSDLMSWKAFRTKYQQGQILSGRTGHSRDYSRSPYGDYDREEGLYFPVNHESDILPQKTLLYVVRNTDIAVGFIMDDLRVIGILTKDGYTATYDEGEVRVEKDGRVLPGFYQMWFSFYTHNRDNYILIKNEK